MATVVSCTHTGYPYNSRSAPQSQPVASGELPPHPAWSPDGATIATCHAYVDTLSLWDGNTLESVRKWPHGHNGLVGSVAFSPDSRRIVTTSEDGIVRV